MTLTSEVTRPHMVLTLSQFEAFDNKTKSVQLNSKL